mmetsp:Transcript_12768/g.39346  ORF Transcript_12768/g.39346 Transcript_12768/m.39346 type:complete len:203 (-) Transcript_12768:247-855(-)
MSRAATCVFYGGARQGVLARRRRRRGQPRRLEGFFLARRRRRVERSRGDPRAKRFCELPRGARDVDRVAEHGVLAARGAARVAAEHVPRREAHARASPESVEGFDEFRRRERAAAPRVRARRACVVFLVARPRPPQLVRRPAGGTGQPPRRRAAATNRGLAGPATNRSATEDDPLLNRAGKPRRASPTPRRPSSPCRRGGTC